MADTETTDSDLAVATTLENAALDVAQPIRKFAAFFREYNVGLSLLVAGIPIPIAIWDLVPIYASTKTFMTLVTSVGCYLAVEFIFSQRSSIAQLYFPLRAKSVAYRHELARSRLFSLTPLALALSALSLFSMYVDLIGESVDRNL